MAAIAEEHVATDSSSSSDDSWRARTPRRWRRSAWLAMLAASLIFLLVQVQLLIDDKNVARFSVDLAAVEGLNATVVGRTVSPGFNLTARVENPRALTPWCSRGGQAVVSYGGVSLAWGRVPEFCAPRNGGAAEVAVEARGRGVGLSDALRRSFVEEWNAGEARVVVEMWLLYDGNGWLLDSTAPHGGVSLVSRELTLPGQGPPSDAF